MNDLGAASFDDSGNCDLVLSPEQEHVLHMINKGQNVFFTGPAGTGKSALLRRIIKKLRPKRKVVNGVAVTASTGIAALNIGGTTLHSFAGIGLGKKPVEKLVKGIKRSLKLYMRWRTTRVLIIDEISMIDATLFDKLEEIARIVRESDEPFGGIQLIICGDFFQLPPVPEKTFKYERHANYAFRARSWEMCIPRPIFLSKVFRQKDPTFISILTHMRQGLLTQDDIRHLNTLSRPLDYHDGILPCELFPVRDQVDFCNKSRLEGLPGLQYAYYAMDSAGYDINGFPVEKKEAAKLLDRIIVPCGILLKPGAQVILTKNIEEGVFVNGSLGRVMDFITVTEAFEREIPISTRESPSDDDNSTIYLRTDENHKLRPMTGHIFSHNEKWPLVQFHNGRKLLCAALEFTVEGPRGNIEACRIQVPLALAWALTIHKSQGQTLDRVKVDLGRAFANGQAYVAISRASSMEGLELRNFSPSKVMVDKRVLDWHEVWNSPSNTILSNDVIDDRQR